MKNILSVSAKVAPELSNNTCIIKINEKNEIRVPILVAASLSTVITKSIEGDPTKQTFKFNISIKGDQENILESIKKLLTNNQPIELNEENDYINLAAFGLAIGNDEFIAPLSEKMKQESSSMNTSNVIKIINAKLVFGEESMGGLDAEISFIAQHFEAMIKNDDFIKFSCNKKHSQIIERIIRSENLKIRREDSLLLFVIKLCKSTIDFAFLFEFVYLEYCSTERCKELLEFVKQQYASSDAKSIILCFGRRIVQPVNLSKKFIEGRHAIEVIDMSDPKNGIFRREDAKGNAEIHASKDDNDSVRKHFLCDDNFQFRMGNKDQFLTANLKDGSKIILSGYMLRGNKENGNYEKLKNWKLEGQKASNDEWILIDRHQNEPFTKLELRTYEVSCEEELKAVRITQEGTNDEGDYWFDINAFDVFGTIVRN